MEFKDKVCNNGARVTSFPNKIMRFWKAIPRMSTQLQRFILLNGKHLNTNILYNFPPFFIIKIFKMTNLDLFAKIQVANEARMLDLQFGLMMIGCCFIISFSKWRQQTTAHRIVCQRKTNFGYLTFESRNDEHILIGSEGAIQTRYTLLLPFKASVHYSERKSYVWTMNGYTVAIIYYNIKLYRINLHL